MDQQFLTLKRDEDHNRQVNSCEVESNADMFSEGTIETLWFRCRTGEGCLAMASQVATAYLVRGMF